MIFGKLGSCIIEHETIYNPSDQHKPFNFTVMSLIRTNGDNKKGKQRAWLIQNMYIQSCHSIKYLTLNLIRQG